MILVGTSIWIDHLRSSDSGLQALLLNQKVLCHPFIIGEVSMGNLKKRSNTLSLLHLLPQATTAKEEEVLAFVENYSLHGLGLGYIDAHLLASVKLSDGALLWTRDKRLAQAAAKLGLAYII